MNFLEIIKKNRELEKSLSGEQFSIGVLTNISINQLKDPVEYFLRVEGINAHCSIGNYNNIIQDTDQFKHCDVVLVFYELLNIFENDIGALHKINKAAYKDIFLKEHLILERKDKFNIHTVLVFKNK